MEGNKMREKLADRLVPALLAIGAVLTAIDVVWTFTVAPLVQGARLSEPAIIAGQVVTTKLLLSQKIFYLHVPVAVASFAAMPPFSPPASLLRRTVRTTAHLARQCRLRLCLSSPR